MYSAGVILHTTKNNERLFLLLHNSQGHWDFPKGRVEHGETMYDAALRELHEEAGLTVQALDPVFKESISYTCIYDGQEYIKEAIFFLAQMPEEVPATLSHEHDDFTWCTLEKAKELLQYKESRDLLTRAKQYLDLYKK